MQDTFAKFALSTGRIFKSSYSDFAIEGRIPHRRKHALSHDHPFWPLWRDHCSSFQSDGANDFIDALIAIRLQQPNWDKGESLITIHQHRKTMRDLLSTNPPHVILLTDMEDYGYYHARAESRMKYICLNKKYVDLWTEAREHQGSEYLALTALPVLRACLDHEIGHWAQSLLRFGQFSKPRSKLWQQTLKSLNVAWDLDNGEAGQFVELRSRGGIMGYDHEKKTAYLESGPKKSDSHYLSHEDLEQYQYTTRFPLKFPSGASLARSKTERYFPYSRRPRCKLDR